MKEPASPIACLICCLFVAGAAQAQQAEGSSDVGPRRVASERPQERGLQESNSEKAKTHGKRSASARPPVDHEELPCPRATWKYDPVCALIRGCSRVSASSLVLGLPPQAAAARTSVS